MIISCFAGLQHLRVVKLETVDSDNILPLLRQLRVHSIQPVNSFKTPVILTLTHLTIHTFSYESSNLAHCFPSLTHLRIDRIDCIDYRLYDRPEHVQALCSRVPSSITHLELGGKVFPELLEHTTRLTSLTIRCGIPVRAGLRLSEASNLRVVATQFLQEGGGESRPGRWQGPGKLVLVLPDADPLPEVFGRMVYEPQEQALAAKISAAGCKVIEV